jgi:phenylalanyl-tRNA synthetase beta chain
MKISRNWLQTYFDKEIPDAQKLAEIFTFHAFEVEGVEKIDKNGDREEDYVLDVKVLPDRAHYALSHRGIASEVAVNAGLISKDRYENAIPASFEQTVEEKIKVEVQNTDFCRRYIARLIKLGNVPKESPVWLKNALNSIGQRSINPIVDATNYVMYDIGQPLHAFDADKVVGKIIVRNATPGEKITLLDGREIELTPEDSVIADEQGALVIAGAKGGKRAEIDENTKNIIIESANFHPTKVRKTSTKYDIRSDSSKRFENEITPELAIHGMHNISKLISEIIPNSSFGPIIDIYPNPAKQSSVNFETNFIRQKLGVEISDNEIKKILDDLGLICSSESFAWQVTVPFERLDIATREDLVEEVGRIYGYDKIVGKLPPTPANKDASILPIFYVSELIKSTLIENGFSEVSLYALVDSGHHEVVKPLARDKAFARSELTKGMISCVERNSLNADLLGLQAIKVFEIGHIFSSDSEKTHLAIGANQIKKIKGYKVENILTETLQKLETVLGVKIDGKITADKTGNTKVVEIDLDKVASAISGNFDPSKLSLGHASTNKYKKFSLYPFVVRDIAVFVPESVGSDSIWEIIASTLKYSDADKLLVRHSLFDTFKKDGRISYAFRLIFQSNEKTLTDVEVNAIMEQLNTAMKTEGWEVR